MIDGILWAMALASLLVAAFYMIHLLLFAPRDRARVSDSKNRPFVSLLKPVKGVNGTIEACVESFFRLDYDHKELLFGVDQEGDEAHRMVLRMMSRYPQVSCRVLVTGHSDRINPKIHKLMALEPLGRGEIFWVSDANVRVAPDTLKRLVDDMTAQKVKLLFSPIRGCGSRSFGSLVENSYINSFLSGNVIAAWKVASHPIIVGKSILLQRAALRQFGGFSFFRQYLAEDYVMGDAYRRSNLSMGMSETWIDNVNAETTLDGVRNRLLRWAQLRIHLKPHVYLLEPTANPLFYALPALVLGGFSRPGWMAGVLLLKVLFELWGFHRLDGWGEARLRQMLLFPLAVLVKDVIMVWVFIVPFFRHSVRWSGEPVRLGAQTRIWGNEWRLMDGV
jgi:ceramide glucosyltransferase